MARGAEGAARGAEQAGALEEKRGMCEAALKEVEEKIKTDIDRREAERVAEKAEAMEKEERRKAERAARRVTPP